MQPTIIGDCYTEAQSPVHFGVNRRGIEVGGSGDVWFTDLKDLSSNTPTSILRYDIAVEMIDVLAS